MRRLILALLLCALPSLAVAQSPDFTIVTRANTAITIANSTTATSIWSSLIPVTLFGNFQAPLQGAAALHLNMLGTITTNPASGCQSAGCVGTVNVGCNYGGTTATIALANAVVYSQGLSASPIILDLWLRSSSTAAPTLTATLRVAGASASITNGGVTTNGPAYQSATVTGTTNINVPQILACSWQWASASTTNSVTWQTGVLAVGD